MALTAVDRPDESSIPIVSAMMPTYNSAATLHCAIESVLAQTFRNWELIIIDDGSTDDTTEIVLQFDDPRIRLHRLPENRGRGYARNMAVKLARGRYIAVCDSDDESLLERFAVEVAFLDHHPDIDVVSAQADHFPDGPMRRPLEQYRYPESPSDIARRFSRGKMAICHAAAMIRTDCFRRYGLYCEECRYAQDLEFFLRMYMSASFQTLPRTLVRYRTHRHASLGDTMRFERYRRYANYRARIARERSGTNPSSFLAYSSRWTVRVTSILEALLYESETFARSLFRTSTRLR